MLSQETLDGAQNNSVVDVDGLTEADLSHPANWKTSEVADWLNSNGLAEYSSLFNDKGIDGKKMLSMTITKGLREIGIDSLTERVKLADLFLSLKQLARTQKVLPNTVMKQSTFDCAAQNSNNGEDCNSNIASLNLRQSSGDALPIKLSDTNQKLQMKREEIVSMMSNFTVSDYENANSSLSSEKQLPRKPTIEKGIVNTNTSDTSETNGKVLSKGR